MTGKDRDIDAIRQKMESAKETILRLPNVVGIGVGMKQVRGKPTDELAIVVLVRIKPPNIKDTDRIPGEIDGVKTDVIEVGEVVAHANTTKIRPAPGGVSIGNATSITSRGTYGCLLQTTMEHNFYILSNNHVIANSNMGSVGNLILQTGDPILQPAPADGGNLLDEVGKLYRFPLMADHQTVDCAIARTPSTSFNDALNRAAQLDGFSEAHQIPGWFGSENQGGGIAVADVSSSGRPDLIVFHVDHPGGGNAGFYRIGRDLDLGGKVTHGWLGPWQVPGWFGHETQGAGIAVADVNGDAVPELVVCHVDNPSSGGYPPVGHENAMYYRVGTTLPGVGVVANWSMPRAVAGWIGHETQAGSVALADFTGDGHPDILAFHIDNPSGDNRGYYRVSRSMYPAALRWAESLNGTAEAKLGERVWKSGRTTEMTNATVTGVSVSIQINFGAPIGVLSCHEQIMIQPDYAQQGDSGSVVVNSERQVIGLHCGGSNYKSLANRIQNVFEALRFGDPRLIPGWFGTENQGGGIAVANVGQLGQTDVIVFHIDHPGGGNSGFYRVGFDLDPNGTIRRPWVLQPFSVPGWFGDENHGGDVTAAYIDGNDQPDLIVFHIDSPGGGNRGYYRIGWNLDRLGRVTGDVNGVLWTAPVLIPGWFGTQNHGGGIAAADIGNDGRLDLIVLHIDSPGGGNNGFFRIGRGLNTTGVITGGWTDPIQIPGWFGTLTQGAGIAAADLRQNGRTDLIVYHIDHTGGGNDAYYRIGWGVDRDGNVADGWTDPIRIPGWFGTETQGGGIAVANLNNNNCLELVALNIDHPSGGNTGYHRVIYDIMGDGHPARWSIA